MAVDLIEGKRFSVVEGLVIKGEVVKGSLCLRKRLWPSFARDSFLGCDCSFCSDRLLRTTELVRRQGTVELPVTGKRFPNHLKDS